MPDNSPTLKARFTHALADIIPAQTPINLSNAYLIGPFENHDWIGLLTSFPPEAVASSPVDLQVSYPGKNGPVSWHRADFLDDGLENGVRLKGHLDLPPYTTVYLGVQVSVPARTAARIAVQCAGIVRAWVNGSLVIAPSIPEQANLEDDQAWITLQAGENQLLVKMMFEGTEETLVVLQVRSYGLLDEVLDKVRGFSQTAGDAAFRLNAKILLAEWLGTSGDALATGLALEDIRGDSYATAWDIAWVNAIQAQYRSSGHFTPLHDPIMTYQPVTSTQPCSEYWPQSDPTPKKILVVDVSQSEPQVEFALAVLQGLVNRKQPRLYLLHTRYATQDRMWLDELHEEGFQSEYISIPETWDLFKSEISGAVIYDGSIMQEIGAFHSDQLNQTNVLMMIGAIENAVPLTPEMNRDFGLPAVFDARGKWSGQYDMMRWAYQNLFPKMNQRILATNYPGIFLLTDYLVEFKIFTFWFPEFRTVIEENLLRGILASTPPNSPIIGWWFDWMPHPQEKDHQHADAVMEGQGVVRGSYFGKFLTPSHEATNLSIHSGVPLAGYRHKTPSVPVYDPNKVYYTFMISDGDNMGEALMMRTREIQWDHPERGQFPMGWSFAPATSRLAPPVLNYYLRTASANDILMGGLGVAYTEPRVYLRAFPDQFEDLWMEYAQATDRAMGWIDSTVLWLINGRHEEADRYALGAGNHLKGIYIGYGGSPEIAEARITHNRVVAFYSATRTHWEDNRPTETRIQAMVDEIRAGVRQRPDFIEAWVLNWGLDMRMLLEVQNRLGPDYVCVRPDVLAQLRLKAE